MSELFIQSSTLTDIANAIRLKNGETITYTPQEMPDAITAIKIQAQSQSGTKSVSNEEFNITLNFTPDIILITKIDSDYPVHDYDSSDNFTYQSNVSLNFINNVESNYAEVLGYYNDEDGEWFPIFWGTRNNNTVTIEAWWINASSGSWASASQITYVAYKFT